MARLRLLGAMTLGVAFVAGWFLAIADDPANIAGFAFALAVITAACATRARPIAGAVAVVAAKQRLASERACVAPAEAPRRLLVVNRR